MARKKKERKKRKKSLSKTEKSKQSKCRTVKKILIKIVSQLNSCINIIIILTIQHTNVI